MPVTGGGLNWYFNWFVQIGRPAVYDLFFHPPGYPITGTSAIYLHNVKSESRHPRHKIMFGEKFAGTMGNVHHI